MFLQQLDQLLNTNTLFTDHKWVILNYNYCCCYCCYYYNMIKSILPLMSTPGWPCSCNSLTSCSTPTLSSRVTSRSRTSHSFRTSLRISSPTPTPLSTSFSRHQVWKLGSILPTFDTLIRRSGHYNAWKVSTWSLPVRIEMLQLMNKISAKILNFVIGWNKPLKFENATKCLNK